MAEIFFWQKLPIFALGQNNLIHYIHNFSLFKLGLGLISMKDFSMKSDKLNDLVFFFISSQYLLKVICIITVQLG